MLIGDSIRVFFFGLSCGYQSNTLHYMVVRKLKGEHVE
jgi:hypothetical protein